MACAIPLGLADHRFLSAEHIGEVAAVAAGGVLAVLAAKGRRSYEEALLNERAARRRSDFVARAGQLLDAPPEPEAMLREIVRMAVPDMAELCIVDLVHDGAARRDDGLRDQPAHAGDAARLARAATRSIPRGRTPSPSSPARAARTCSTRSEPSACARSRSTSSTSS